MRVINVSKAKNSLLPLLTVPTIVKGKYLFKSIDLFTDIQEQINILNTLNIKTIYSKNDLFVDSTNMIIRPNIRIQQTNSTRGIVYFMGSLIKYKSIITLSKPGGCQIGQRKLDMHFNFFSKLGVDIKENDTEYILDCTNYNENKDFEYVFDRISVGATINSLLSSITGNQGTILLKNIATDPYISDVVSLLNKIGFHIDINIKSRQISYQRKPIYSMLTSTIIHSPLDDPIIIGTYIALSIIFNKEYIIPICDIKILGSFLDFLSKVGISYETKYPNQYLFYVNQHISRPNSVHIITKEFPGFYTDLQPIALLLCKYLNIEAYITDNIMDSRFGYINQLKKIGYKCDIIDNNNIHYTHFHKIEKCDTVTLPDLRGGLVVYVELYINKFDISKINIKNIDVIKRGYNMDYLHKLFLDD